jgi:hypothetical protein
MMLTGENKRNRTETCPVANMFKINNTDTRSKQGLRFGRPVTNRLSHLQGSSSPCFLKGLIFEIGPIGCSETSLTNSLCHVTSQKTDGLSHQRKP